MGSRTRIAAAVALGATVAFWPAGASATQAGPEGLASGSVGEVNVVHDGEEVVVEPIAPCDVAGTLKNSSERVTADGIADFWGGETECSKNDKAVAQVVGRYFRTDALYEWGGPRIRVSSFKVRCETQENGASGTVELRGVRGIEMPERIPPNYTVTIPGRIENAPPIGRVIINEFVAPDPPDGSMTMNAMRIELFPEGGAPDSGDIVIGSVSCDPYGITP